jgi:hypothetical protein
VPELVGVARLTRGENCRARVEYPEEQGALAREVRLAHLEQFRDLVVPLAQQGIEIVPGASRSIGGGNEAVVRRDEREHGRHDRAEHEKPEQHRPIPNP